MKLECNLKLPVAFDTFVSMLTFFSTGQEVARIESSASSEIERDYIQGVLGV